MAAVNPFLNVQNLFKRIGDLVLLDSVSFGISEGQHVGLIAKNGAGKSTLLNILTGSEDYEKGEIVYRNGLKVGYLEQSPHYPDHLTVIEACFWKGGTVTDLVKAYELCLSTYGNPGLDELLDKMECAQAWDYERKAKQILTQLDIKEFNQKIKTLSGGQLKRVALANVLLVEPDLLILDEPTNHLDLSMIEWLEHYLQRSSKGLLMVTHDRYFLDRVCSCILELDNRTIYTYSGNYAYYLEKKQERIDAENAEIARANNLYRKELEWMHRMPSARSHKPRYREEAFYELEKSAKRKMTETTATLLVQSSYIGNKIIEIHDVNKAFSSRVILKKFQYVFSRYEKMGIVGNNGTGKSTFIKMLLGLEPVDSGNIVVGETVRFGYYSQDGIKFDRQMKVIDVVRNIAETVDLGDGHRLTASQFLQYFLFTPETQYSYVYKLSGGEQRRLYLCTVLMRNPNFLILDEPTNDLDIVTLQVLEEYLKKFRGCVIIVSHDRYFMDKVVDHLLVFEGEGKIRDFPGNYSQYREWKGQKDAEITINASQKKQKSKDNEKINKSIRINDKHRLTYQERKEKENLEREIERLEEEKKEIELSLSAGNLSVSELIEKSKLLPLLQKELDEKSERWFELAELEKYKKRTI